MKKQGIKNPYIRFIKSTDESQENIAGRFGITPGYLSMLIAGKRHASLELSVDIELETGGAIKAVDIVRPQLRDKLRALKGAFDQQNGRSGKDA